MLLTAERHGPAGQGYCQGGFSADFTKVRELLAGFYIITQSLFLCFWLVYSFGITQCTLDLQSLFECQNKTGDTQTP